MKHLPFILLSAATPSLSIGFMSATVAAQSPGQKVGPEAMELARTTMPLAAYVGRELRTGRQGIVMLPSIDADAKALEEQYPGIHKHLWQALEPEVRRDTTETHPRRVTRMAEVFQTHLSAEQMVALQTFYLTPTGQRVIRTMYEGADASPIMKELVEDPDGEVSAEAAMAAQASARAKVQSETGPADQEAFVALMRSVPKEKMQAVSQSVLALTTEWINEEDPEAEARLEKIAIEAAERYIEQHSSSER